MEESFTINQYEFNTQLPAKLSDRVYERDKWPLVYILSNSKKKEAYVGETTDTVARMQNHLANPQKQTLTTVHLISSSLFNKSVTLDTEANLIKYIAGDGRFRLQNGNTGLGEHNFYQKNELYRDIFRNIWERLRSLGIAEKSLEAISNSDLFKYSPYKSLSRDQMESLKAILDGLLDDETKTVIVNGGAGTGKSILAIFLFKLLNTDLENFSFPEFDEQEKEFMELIGKVREKYPKPRMALVVPMSSFRKTLSKVFSNIKGLKGDMVVGPADVTRREYDILIVDESHRLRRSSGAALGPYQGAFKSACIRLGLAPGSSSELEWVRVQSRKAVLFYDEHQSVRPSDVRKEDFMRLLAQPSSRKLNLKTQFRVKGGDDYVRFIHRLLDQTLPEGQKRFSDPEYDLRLFDSLADMLREIRQRDREYGLSRLVAGFAWPWVSKDGKVDKKYDIEIEGIRLRWNSVASDWINSENASNEVGCIHTTQGYDLNYCGVIFGNEILFNPGTGRIEVDKAEYYDKMGKTTVRDPQELHDYIVNIYKTICLRGISGTYIYVCNPELRQYLAQHIPRHSNGRAVAPLQFQDAPGERTVPFHDIKAAAGGFSEEQHAGNVKFLRLPDNLPWSPDLFACKVTGESMNKIIPDGSICLFERYSGGSRLGKIVLATASTIHDIDYGAHFTVKEYQSEKIISENGWEHSAITLVPRSTDPRYQPIKLSVGSDSDFKVVGVFKGVIG